MSTETTLTIHNLSNFNFEKQELDLLHKGLSFAQTSLIKQQLQLLKQFDNFAKTIREHRRTTSGHSKTPQRQYYKK